MVETAWLVLGCFGRVESEFVLCSAIENRILKLGDQLNNFHKLAEYLDKVNLFDRPMLDNNSIRHVLYNLQDRFDQKTKRLWTDHQYNLLERFMQTHKPCGFYLKSILSLEEDENEEDLTNPAKNEEIFLIKAQPELRQIPQKKPIWK